MGSASVLEHVNPGIIFLLGGLWWSAHIFCRYFQSHVKEYRNSCYFQWRGRYNVEAYVILLSPIWGALLLDVPVNGVHLTMMGHMHLATYLPFMLAGLVALLKSRWKWVIPENVDYLLLAQSFALTGMLLYFCNVVEGKEYSLMYTFEIYIVLGITACLFWEMSQPQAVLPALARAFFTSLLGSWLLQLTYCEHLSDVDERDVEQGMMAVFLVWHYIGNVLLMGLVGMGVYRWNRSRIIQIEYQILEKEVGKRFEID